MTVRFNQISFFLVIFSLTFVLVNFSPAAAQRNQPTAPKTAAPEISYTVSMPKPATHLLEVEMRLRQNLSAQTEIAMPVWTPGSYLIREYARHVQDFGAKDQSGKALNWEKTNKNTWRIATGGANEIVVSYRVYANELTVRTNELNDRHAFWNNAALLMFPKGQLNAPSTLRVVPFGNWKVATGLEQSGAPNTFRAVNFDILYDSPFEVGTFDEISFDVRGVPHRMVFEGGGNYDLARIKRDVPKIVEAAVSIFNEVPYKNYLFIVNTRGGGGLEHLNSTALQFSRFGFAQNHDGFLGLVAHEFFHLFNVKRIRPDALGPFDYENENYTKLLWVAEGGTEYYSNVILKRAGFIDAEQYLAARADGIEALQNRPGRFQTSVEEASFDAWIKGYRPDENAFNREISYYDKGEIVNLMLDLTIRKSSNGAKSLDDVMRYLYTEFAKKNRNYTPEDFQKAAEAAAGTSLEDFFRRYVRGRDEINYNEIFQNFGLRLDSAVPNAAARASLGANLRQQGDFLSVAIVPAGTPAYEQGLNTGDLIVALDGFRVANQNDLTARLGERKPGDKIRLTIFRFDEMRDLQITLGGRAPENYRFVAAPNATAEQQRLLQSWLGAE